MTGLERIAQVENPRATVWKGGEVPTHEQGIKVLGTPLGHNDFVAHHLRQVAREQQGLLDKIPLVRDLQSAWLLLLHCAAARANYQLRSVRPSATEEYARTHDEGVWQCLATLLGTDLGQCSVAVRELATLPLRLGGLGLTSAVRIRGSAHWGSWADCLPMIHERHPEVAGVLLEQLNGEPDPPCLLEAQEAARRVSRATGWEPPSWNELAAGARPEGVDQDQFEPWDPHRGWQHEAASRMESWWMHEFVFPRMDESARALVLSQGGAGAGLALRACPTCRLTRLEPQHFRVLLLRRLQLPLPLSMHSCRCGRPLDQFGHHRAACARAGILGKRGFALESVLARVCREAGGRVTTNVLLRELDIGLMQMAGGWRSWLMGFRCLAEPNLQWTLQS